MECNNDADDIYNFAFMCVGEEIKTQPITNTQQILLPQKSHGHKISPNWILLDSQSMINIFNNRKFFKYIRKCEPNESVRCYCNGGYQDTDEIGEVPGIGLVYYNPRSLANRLSLSQIDNKYRVTYDSSNAKAFLCTILEMGRRSSSGAEAGFTTTIRQSIDLPTTS